MCMNGIHSIVKRFKAQTSHKLVFEMFAVIDLVVNSQCFKC